MNTILLAYDDTSSGKVALQRAAEMTARLDAELIVVTVAPVVNGGGRVRSSTRPTLRRGVITYSTTLVPT